MPDSRRVPESPCTNDCCLDGDVCVSCGRTIDEIVAWSSLTDAEKQEILDRLNDR